MTTERLAPSRESPATIVAVLVVGLLALVETVLVIAYGIGWFLNSGSGFEDDGSVASGLRQDVITGFFRDAWAPMLIGALAVALLVLLLRRHRQLSVIWIWIAAGGTMLTGLCQILFA